jgi:hypothetical protein
MGARFFTMCSPSILSDFLFFLPFFFPSPSAEAAPVEVGGDFWGWLEEVWRKSDVDGAVHHHLKNLVKTDKAVVHHQPVLEFQALAEPTLDPDF